MPIKSGLFFTSDQMSPSVNDSLPTTRSAYELCRKEKMFCLPVFFSATSALEKCQIMIDWWSQCCSNYSAFEIFWYSSPRHTLPSFHRNAVLKPELCSFSITCSWSALLSASIIRVTSLAFQERVFNLPLMSPRTLYKKILFLYNHWHILKNEHSTDDLFAKCANNRIIVETF